MAWVDSLVHLKQINAKLFSAVISDHDVSMIRKKKHLSISFFTQPVCCTFLLCKPYFKLEIIPITQVVCKLTDSGRRSTFTWSPSSKPSGTLFCINRGMLRFRFLSDWGPFCHSSSCLLESGRTSWRCLVNFVWDLMTPSAFPQNVNTNYIPCLLIVQTFDEFFDSLRIHGVIVLGCFCCFAFTPLALGRSVYFVPAVLLDQRDDELFGLLWGFCTTEQR